MKKYTLKDYENIEEFIATRDYIKAMKEENFDYIVYLIESCEFEIEINENGTINLIDLQGAYLGDIGSYDNFENVFMACERLEGSFLRDYFGIYV